MALQCTVRYGVAFASLPCLCCARGPAEGWVALCCTCVRGVGGRWRRILHSLPPSPPPPTSPNPLPLSFAHVFCRSFQWNVTVASLTSLPCADTTSFAPLTVSFISAPNLPTIGGQTIFVCVTCCGAGGAVCAWVE